jgi:hypothetical protein
MVVVDDDDDDDDGGGDGRWDEEQAGCTFAPEINEHSRSLIEERERLQVGIRIVCGGV